MIISKERLQELRNRTKRCVCKYCGSNLTVRLIDFGRIECSNMEIFCKNCERIEYGVEREIYEEAIFFVDNIGFTCNTDSLNNEVTRRYNIAKVCDIISWHDRQIGILNKDGYNITLVRENMNLDYTDGSILIFGDSIWSDIGEHDE